MAAIEGESKSAEENSPAYNPEDYDHTPWNNSQTCMLIAYFKDDPILWDKQVKDMETGRNRSFATDFSHLLFPCAQGPYTRRVITSLQRFVPTTCPTEFNKLNSM